MSVQKIFKTLIIVVACVIIGAFVLNALVPNVIAGLSNSIETMLQNATGMTFDLNGDGTGKSGTGSGGVNSEKGTQSAGGAGVQGYSGSGDSGSSSGNKNGGGNGTAAGWDNKNGN